MTKIYSNFLHRIERRSNSIKNRNCSRAERIFLRFNLGFVLMLLLSITGSLSTQAQTMANYTFSTVTNGSLENLSAGSTALITGINNDTATNIQSIGFEFYYMGIKYTHFSANSNGQVRLHASQDETAISGTGITNFVASTVTLAPMAGTNEVSDGMRIKVIGTAPNRKLVIEWTKFCVQVTDINNAGNMQLWLSETSSIIEFVYGEIYNASTFSQARSIFMSSGNTATTSGYVRVLSSPSFTSAAAPVTNTFASSSIVSGIASPVIANLGSTSDGNRRIYKFTPPSTVSGDVINLSFSALTSNSTTLTWNDNATNENFFLVTRATDASFTQNVESFLVSSTTTAATGTLYSSVQSGLSSGSTYYFKVVAAVEGGGSTGLTGSQTTTGSSTYYWTGLSGGSWNTFSNWNTAPDGSGSNPASWTSSDVHIIDGTGTTPGGDLSILVNRANFTVSQFKITNNTNLTLSSDNSTTRNITISGGPSVDFFIESGSTLNLTSVTNAVAFGFSGSGNSGIIDGTYVASGSGFNVITTTGGSNTLVKISSAGSITNNINSTNSCIIGSLPTILFENGSNYFHTNSSILHYIPGATWQANATATLEGNGTGISSPSLNFGNLVINCTGFSGVLGAFNALTSKTIQGNLIVNSTGTGRLRAVTTGVLTINGNLQINAGIFEVGNNNGSVIVKGTTTVASGSTLDFNRGSLKSQGNMILNGNALSSETSTVNSYLEFTGSGVPQTLTGTGTFTGRISNLGVSNPLGLTLSTPLVTENVYLIAGTITNSSNITFGSGSTLSRFVQIGSATNITSGGNFDSSPNFNMGTGTYTIYYLKETTPRVIGFEIPSTKSINSLYLDNASGLTISGGSLEVLNTLTLANGIINTTNTNSIIHGSPTLAGTITGGSTTSYIKGPLVRTINNTNNAFIIFPVGKSNYAPIYLAPTTTTVSTFKAESFETNTGTPSSLIMNLSATRRWEASLLSGAFTDMRVGLGNGSITASNIPVQAPSASGIYNSTFGINANYTPGPPPYIQSISAINAVDFTGFLSFADAKVCAGSPMPGNTLASLTSICLGASTTLSIENTITDLGITYQWQYSLNGIDYAAIPSANSATYIATPTEPTFYRCKVTCAIGPAISFSTPIQINTLPILKIVNPDPIDVPATANLTASSITTGSDDGLTFTYFTNLEATNVLSNPNAVGIGTYYIKGTNGDGCFAIAPVIVSSATTTFISNAWTYGVPTASVNAIIAENFTTTGDLSVKSLTINSGKVFTVATGTTLTIVTTLTNNAGLTGFVVESDGVVLQNSTVTNTALATVKRNSTPLFRQDYTVWSSPVFEPNLRNFSPQTLFNRFSTYDFSTSENGGYKQEINNNEEVLSKKFVNAKGYLIRMPNNANEVASGNAQTFVGEFKGVLNNGTITIPLYGNVPGTSNGLNLVGNPYPSPININTFFAENTQLTSGTMYFWRKKGSASDTNNSISGYATYNALGMVSADGTIQGQTLTHIKPGQGFFVKTAQATPADLVFNNTMRESTSTLFFKSSNQTATELNRFWLNLSKEGTSVGQTLIGYTEGATQEVDSSFDALYFNDAPLALTSLVNNEEYIIQGRALPFSSNDVVPLSFKTDIAGSFTISLSNFDGLFASNQDIFLKDKFTNTVQNLKTAAYTFTAPVGVFNNRFEVQYDSVLGTNNPNLGTNTILIGVKNQQIKINAGTVMMEKIELIDLSGRVLYTLENVNSTLATIENVVSSNQMLIVRISTKENGVVNQKIIF